MRSLTLVVIRITTTGLNNSKPCKECCEVIKKAGIKKVIYSVVGGFIQESVNRLSNEHQSLGTRKGLRYPSPKRHLLNKF